MPRELISAPHSHDEKECNEAGSIGPMCVVCALLKMKDLTTQRDALLRGAEKLFERLPEAAMLGAELRLAVANVKKFP
jgi:hypothetical protein